MSSLSPQGTGWSALHFSAESGDWDTTRGLLEAGASPHLIDKVCGVADIIFLHLLSVSITVVSLPPLLLYLYLHYCCISTSITVVSLPPLLSYLYLHYCCISTSITVVSLPPLLLYLSLHYCCISLSITVVSLPPLLSYLYLHYCRISTSITVVSLSPLLSYLYLHYCCISTSITVVSLPPLLSYLYLHYCRISTSITVVSLPPLLLYFYLHYCCISTSITVVSLPPLLLYLYLHYWCISLSITVVPLSPLPVKNGLTAMDIAEVKAEEGGEGRPHRYGEERPDYNYEGVTSLLRKYCTEEPTTTPSHHVSITISLITKLWQYSSHSTGQLHCTSGHSPHSTGHTRYHPDTLYSSEKRKKKHISGVCWPTYPHIPLWFMSQTLYFSLSLSVVVRLWGTWWTSLDR